MEIKMYKKQMLVQKIVCFAILAAAALVFIYSLGLVTDLHYNNFAYYAENPERPKFEGANIYNEIQPFNRELTKWGIFLILSALLLFVFGTHKRRKYYVGNYVAIGLNSSLMIGVSVWGIRNVAIYRQMYDNIDFEKLEKYQNMLKKDYDISPFWFDVGYYVFAFAIIAAVLGILSLAFKIIVMRGERKLLEEV